MATSTNYGWAEPDNSSLVKNGASDIRTLGNAIDASLWNVGYGNAGKNKIINGAFDFWQRGATFTGIANDTYSADRWVVSKDKTANLSQQSFTAGTAPVAGYEGTYYLRQAISGGSYYAVLQRIEDVRTFAGQTVTVSFWAKADATVSNTIGINQYFGSGGSATVSNYATAANLTTSWARYSYTVTLGSLTGKTIGTGNYLIVQPILIQNGTTHTIDIWGVQLEVGSIATPFSRNASTIQGELAACQRYYYVVGGVANQYPIVSGNLSGTGSQIRTPIKFGQTMRVAPTITKNGTWAVSSNTSQPSATFIGTEGFSIEISSTSGAVPAGYAYPDSSDDSFTCSAEL